MMKQTYALILITILTIVVFNGCEINPAGQGRWQKLPELSKPREAQNIDKGGEFRKILFDLYEIKLEENEPIKSVVTFYDIAYFAGGMTAGLVETRIVAAEPTDLYNFQPDTEKVLPALKEAHVVFKVGLGLDDWIDPLVEEAQQDNPKLIVVDLTRNIDLIGDNWNPDPRNPSKIDKYNPWFWLNPDNVMSLADTFYQVFITLKPLDEEAMREGSGVLQHNMQIFPSSQAQMKGIQNKILVQDVPCWSSFAQYFDLTITSTLMPDGVSAPSDEELNNLAEKAKQDGVVAIIKSNGYGSGVADRFAELTELPVVELDPHPKMQETGMSDYFQQVMGNTNRLLMKFRELGLPEEEYKPPPPEEETPGGANIEIDEETRKKLEEMAKEKAAEQDTDAENKGE